MHSGVQLQAYMMLCFGVLMKTLLITHQYFSCCTAVLTLSQGLCFSCCPARAELRVHKELGTGTARTADPDRPKGCPIACGCVFVLPGNYHTG